MDASWIFGSSLSGLFMLINWYLLTKISFMIWLFTTSHHIFLMLTIFIDCRNCYDITKVGVNNSIVIVLWWCFSSILKRWSLRVTQLVSEMMTAGIPVLGRFAVAWVMEMGGLWRRRGGGISDPHCSQQPKFQNQGGCCICLSVFVLWWTLHKGVSGSCFSLIF